MESRTGFNREPAHPPGRGGEVERGDEGRGQMGREQRKGGGCGEEVHGWGISSNSYSAREKQRKSDEREQERMEMEKTKKRGKGCVVRRVRLRRKQRTMLGVETRKKRVLLFVSVLFVIMITIMLSTLCNYAHC